MADDLRSHARMIFCLLMMLPEELIMQILLRAIEDGGHVMYMYLRDVCTTFRRICDEDEVVKCVSFQELRHFVGWRPALVEYFKERFRRAGHREAVCYEGMEHLMTGASSVGRERLQVAVDAGDSGAAYLMAMLRYRSNPVDPEALVLVHGISGGPVPDGRWENRMARPRGFIREDLRIVAHQFRLVHRYVDPQELLVEDPHVCSWAQCRRFRDGGGFIRYCSGECRIRHEYNLWTRHVSGRVAYAIIRM